jgi:hypothetical protein
LALAYPEAKTIHLVMDNLNIHHKKPLTDLYGAEFGGEIWDRFTVLGRPGISVDSRLGESEEKEPIICPHQRRTILRWLQNRRPFRAEGDGLRSVSSQSFLKSYVVPTWRPLRANIA